VKNKFHYKANSTRHGHLKNYYDHVSERRSTEANLLSPKYTRNFSLFGIILNIILIIHPIATITKYKIFYFAAILSLYVVSLHTMLIKHFPFKHIFDALPVYFFFAIMFISYFWALYPIVTIWSSSISLIFLWIFEATRIASYRKSRSWLHSLVILLPYVYLGLFSIIITKYGTVRPDSSEIRNVVHSFSDLGPAILELCFPYLIYIWMSQKNKRKLLIIGSFISVILVTIISESRAAYALLLVNSFFIAILFGRNFTSKVRYMLWFGSYLGLISLVAILVFGYNRTIGSTIERFKGSHVQMFGDQPDKRAYDYVRAVMYYEGLHIIKEYPLTGIGFGGLGPHIEATYGFFLISHNIFITAWGELGIVGLLLFLYIVISAFVRLWRMRNISLNVNITDFYFYSSTLVALIVAVLHAQFRQQLNNPFIYVIFGISFSLPRHRDDF
jgi:O-antigen ligase